MLTSLPGLVIEVETTKTNSYFWYDLFEIRLIIEICLFLIIIEIHDQKHVFLDFTISDKMRNRASIFSTLAHFWSKC